MFISGQKFGLKLCIFVDGRKFDEDDPMIEALKCNLDLEYFVKLTSWRYLTANLRLKVRTIRIYLFPSSHPEDYIISSSEDFQISQVERQRSRLESRWLWWVLKPFMGLTALVSLFPLPIKLLRNFFNKNLTSRITFDQGLWWTVSRKIFLRKI